MKNKSNSRNGADAVNQHCTIKADTISKHGRNRKFIRIRENRFVFLILAVALVIITGCDGIIKTTKTESDNLGIWKIKYFVDEFNEPTKEGYITTTKPIQGKYSVGSIKNTDMQAHFIIVSKESIAIRFESYGNLIVGGHLISYRVLVQNSEGERYTLSASNYNSDKLSFSNSDAKKMYDILLKGGNIKFKIYSDDMLGSEYSFTIDNADGLENAYVKLTGGSNLEKTEKDASPPANIEDFQSFIQTFTSDKDFQLSHIKFPLRLIKSKAQWEFLGTDDIFEGIKKTEEFDFRGTFDKESDNKYRYTLYTIYLLEEDGVKYDYGELLFGLDFSKIDSEWMVTDIFYDGVDEE